MNDAEARFLCETIEQLGEIVAELSSRVTLLESRTGFRNITPEEMQDLKRLEGDCIMQSALEEIRLKVDAHYAS